MVEMIKVTMEITSSGKNLEVMFSTRPRRNQQATVVAIVMQTFAINMNTPPIELTNANLALFLRTRIKALRADEQKFSLEIAR